MPVFMSHHIFKGNIPLILTIERSVHFVYVYLPAIVILFVHSMVNKKNRGIEIAAFVLSFIFSLFTFTDYYFNVMLEYRWGYIARAGIAFDLFGLYSFCCIIYCIILIMKKMKTGIDDYTRLKIKYIMIAIISMAVLTTGNIPAMNGIDIYPPGNFAFISMLFMAWGIYRHDVIKMNLYSKRRIVGAIVRMFVTAGLIAAILVCWWALANYSLSHIFTRIIPYGIPPLLSFICCVFLSYLSLRLGENRKDSIIFSILMLVYALLSIDIYLNSIINDPYIGLRVSRFSHIFVVFIPALGMHLMRSVTDRQSETRLLYGNYLICFILLLFSQSDYYLQGMYLYSWGQFARKAILFDLMSVLATLTLAYNILILLAAYRQSNISFLRSRYLFLLIGSASTAVMSLGNVPAMNGYDIYPLGNFIFIPAAIFAVALFRHNITEIMRFSGMFVYYGVISAAVFAAVWVLALNHSDDFLPVYTGISFFSILVFNFFLRRLRDYVSGRHADKLKIAFENLSDKLSRARSFDEIEACISRSFFTDLDCVQCAVLIYKENLNKYTGKKLWNNQIEFMHGLPVMENSQSINIDPGHPLLDCIRIKHSYMKQEEIEFCILNNELAVDYNDPLRQFEIILPVFFENHLSALILLGVKIDASVFSSNETGFLYQLGINLGPHIENVIILQQLEETLEERTKKLRDSEEKYRNLIENANDIIYKADWRGYFIYSNPAFHKKFEYTSEEIRHLHYLDLIPPDNRDDEFAFYSSQLKNKTDQSHRELPVLAKSGRILWIVQDVKSIKDENGRIVEFDCIVHDITDRKAAEDALRESEERFRLVVENVNDAVFICKFDGHLKYMSPTIVRITGYSSEEMLNAHYLHFIHPDCRKGEFDLYKKQVQENVEVSVHEYPFITKHGGIIWVGQTVRMVKNDTGEIEFFGVIRDISDRKAAENALRESEMRYQQLMENVSDCVFICRLDGHFKYINPAVTRLTGIPPNDLIGTHYLSIVHPDYREKQMKFYQKQVSDNIETTYCEFQILIKNNETRWVGQTVRMIRNNEGEIEFYGIALDISALKKAEEARRDLEEAKTNFFANISHEIRTPLTLMLGPIESVLHGDYGKEVDNEFFKNLHRNTLSLLKLVNNLLDFSKIEAGKMILRVQEGDIVYFARHYLESIRLAGKSKNINLFFNSSSGSIIVCFDPERLDKVFMNLLSNALKFTGEGGSISITLSEDEDNCLINVSDNGDGISEKDIVNIFDRFCQSDRTSPRKHEGTGIGLALAKELVELHGGSISVESRHIQKYPDDHGSTFTVILPKGIKHFEKRANVEFVEKRNLDDWVKDYRQIGLREIEPLKISDSILDCHAEGGETQFSGIKKTILVVDDNEDMQNFMKILLQKHYKVILAENGEEGINRARILKPDLIVTDVMMPVMNGFEMTSIIKNDNELKIIPIIMLTADTEFMNKVAGLEYGADDYLHKPFNSMELLTRIASLLKNYEFQQIISRRNADIESELEVARLLQQRLFPSSMPEISGYHEHVIYIPMDKIGGDFYDIENRDGFLNLFIADVSGHGLPGAFLATVTKIALENISIRTSSNKVLYLLNNVILRHTVQSNYVTAFFATIDINTNLMRYASAGHVSPILYRKKNDEFIELKTKGKPLGWFKDVQIDEKTIQLDSGDRIILYTDGLTECMDYSGELFGEERLRKIIKDYSCKPAVEFSKELMKELEIFNGSNSYEDDITMVVLDVL